MKEATKAARVLMELERIPYVLATTCVAGIYIFYLLFSLVQEHIYEIRDSADKPCRCPLFLVFVTCVFNCLLAGSVLLVSHDFKPSCFHLHRMARRHILIQTLTYTGSLFCTYYALSHVNVPTQVIVKSAKMVPIVVGGFIFYKKRYPLYEYVSVAVVTASLVLFNLDRMRSGNGQQTVLGLFFLLCSLIFDGMTGPNQDRMLSQYNVSALQMMFHTNLFASVWSMLAFVAFEGLQPVAFVARHAVFLVLLFGVCSGMGQMFIFIALRNFGSLHLALITTTRKFFTVLLSILWFRHQLSLSQWIAVAAMFSALLSHSYIHSQSKERGKCLEKKTDVRPRHRKGKTDPAEIATNCSSPECEPVT